jgi:anti-sigma regulatory factor (Ser/Thr protein kinase)
MAVLEMKCPPNLTEDEVIPFLMELEKARDAHELSVKFGSIIFGEPYGTMLLGQGIKNVVEYRKASGNRTLVADAASIEIPATLGISYLAHIGFFKYLGLNFGKSPNEAPGSTTYLPITVISREELVPTNEKKVFQDVIEEKSDALSKLVFTDDMQQIMLGYCLREVIRNVFEHANADSCTLMAQKWEHRCEIAIMDFGRGIQQSLAESLPPMTAKDSILEAIKPGVSRIVDNANESAWANSGFGLFVISELGRRYGEFSIASSMIATKFSPTTATFTPYPYTGTCVKLRIDTKDADYFPNILLSIVKDGEIEYERKTGKKKKASRRSSIWGNA